MTAKNEHLIAYTADPFIQDVVTYPSRLLKQGKRQRPYVAMLMYLQAGGAHYHELLKLLVGLEVFHAFCLVHDDVIDRGTERHGIPTVHQHIKSRLESKRRLGDLTHLSNGQAMLIGDLLFSYAHEALNESALPPGRIRAAREIFTKMIHEVVMGQIIDVDVMTRPSASDSLIEQKMYLKTASYTFIRPMQLGVRLASPRRNLDDFCERYGGSLGIAFQLQDDYLDLTASPADYAKTLFADLREGQHTYFTQYIADHGTPCQKKRLRRYFGRPVTLTDRNDIIDLFQSSGALEGGKACSEHYFAEAKRALLVAKLKPSVEEQLDGLVEYMRRRKR